MTLNRSAAVGVVAAGYGLFLAWLAALGDLTKYLRPSYQPLTYAAIAGLFLLAFLAWRCRPGRQEPGARLGLLPFVILLLPLALGVAVPRVVLEAGGVDRAAIDQALAGGAASSSAARMRELLDGCRRGDRYEAPLSVLVQLLRRPETEFDSLPVRTTGWLLHRGSQPPSLLRYLMVCCAADLRPLGVALAGVEAIPAPDNAWLEVEGSLGPAVNGLRPLVVERWKTVAPPAEPYLYR